MTDGARRFRLSAGFWALFSGLWCLGFVEIRVLDAVAAWGTKFRARQAFAENVETNNCFNWKKACKMRQMLFTLGLGASIWVLGPFFTLQALLLRRFPHSFPHSSHFSLRVRVQVFCFQFHS